MKAHHAVYTSLKGIQRSGYQIAAHSGLSREVLDQVSEHSTLRRQIPPGYEFKSAVSVQELTPSLIGATFLFNAGTDFAGRPNRVFAHTICIDKKTWRALGYNNFTLYDLFYKDESVYEADLPEGAVPGSASLPMLDISPALEVARSWLGGAAVRALEDFVNQMGKVVDQFNLTAESVSKAIGTLIDGGRVLLVVPDEADAIELVRLITMLLPAPLRERVFPMSLSMDPTFHPQHHRLLVAPKSVADRYGVGSLPPTVVELNLLERPSEPVEVTGWSYADRVARLVELVPSKAFAFAREVEARMLNSPGDMPARDMLRRLMESDYKAALAERSSDDQVAAQQLLEAASLVEPVDPERAVELYEQGIDKSLLSSDFERVLPAAEHILRLVAQYWPDKYQLRAQIMLQGLADARVELLSAYIRTVLENVPGNDKGLKLQFSMDVVNDLGYMLEESYAPELFSVFREQLDEDTFLKLCIDHVHEGGESVFGPLMREAWFEYAEQRRDLRTALGILELVPSERVAEKRVFVDRAGVLAVQCDDLPTGSKLLRNRVESWGIDKSLVSHVKDFQKDVIERGTLQDIRLYVEPVLAVIAEQNAVEEYTRLVADLLSRVRSRARHADVVALASSFLERVARLRGRVSDVLKPAVDSLKSLTTRPETMTGEQCENASKLVKVIADSSMVPPGDRRPVASQVLESCMRMLSSPFAGDEPFLHAVRACSESLGAAEVARKVDSAASELLQQGRGAVALRAIRLVYEVLATSMPTDIRADLVRHAADAVIDNTSLADDKTLSWLKAESDALREPSIAIQIRLINYARVLRVGDIGGAVKEVDGLVAYATTLRTDRKMSASIQQVPGKLLSMTLTYMGAAGALRFNSDDARVLVGRLTDAYSRLNRRGLPDFVAQMMGGLSGVWDEPDIVRWLHDVLVKTASDRKLRSQVVKRMQDMVTTTVEDRDFRAAISMLPLVVQYSVPAYKAQALSDIVRGLSKEDITHENVRDIFDLVWDIVEAFGDTIQKEEKIGRNLVSLAESIEKTLRTPYTSVGVADGAPFTSGTAAWADETPSRTGSYPPSRTAGASAGAGRVGYRPYGGAGTGAGRYGYGRDRRAAPAAVPSARQQLTSTDFQRLVDIRRVAMQSQEFEEWATGKLATLRSPEERRVIVGAIKKRFDDSVRLGAVEDAVRILALVGFKDKGLPAVQLGTGIDVEGMCQAVVDMLRQPLVHASGVKGALVQLAREVKGSGKDMRSRDPGLAQAIAEVLMALGERLFELDPETFDSQVKELPRPLKLLTDHGTRARWFANMFVRTGQLHPKTQSKLQKYVEDVGKDCGEAGALEQVVACADAADRVRLPRDKTGEFVADAVKNALKQEPPLKVLRFLQQDDFKRYLRIEERLKLVTDCLKSAEKSEYRDPTHLDHLKNVVMDIINNLETGLESGGVTWDMASPVLLAAVKTLAEAVKRYDKAVGKGPGRDTRLAGAFKTIDGPVTAIARVTREYADSKSAKSFRDRVKEFPKHASKDGLVRLAEEVKAAVEKREKDEEAARKATHQGRKTGGGKKK